MVRAILTWAALAAGMVAIEAWGQSIYRPADNPDALRGHGIAQAQPGQRFFKRWAHRKAPELCEVFSMRGTDGKLVSIWAECVLDESDVSCTGGECTVILGVEP